MRLCDEHERLRERQRESRRERQRERQRDALEQLFLIHRSHSNLVPGSTRKTRRRVCRARASSTLSSIYLKLKEFPCKTTPRRARSITYCGNVAAMLRNRASRTHNGEYCASDRTKLHETVRDRMRPYETVQTRTFVQNCT